MFYDLKSAYQSMVKKATYIVDDNGIHITFPQHLFDRFEQEFNLSFLDEEDDIHRCCLSHMNVMTKHDGQGRDHDDSATDTKQPAEQARDDANAREHKDLPIRHRDDGKLKHDC